MVPQIQPPMREEGAFVSLTQSPFLRAVRHPLAEASGQADLGKRTARTRGKLLLSDRTHNRLQRGDDRFGFRATRHVVRIDMREANDTLPIDDKGRRNRKRV